MNQHRLTQSDLVQIGLSLSQAQRDELLVCHRRFRKASSKLVQMGLCDEYLRPTKLGRQVLEAVGEGFKRQFELPGDPTEMRRAFTKQQRDDFAKTLLEQLYIADPKSDEYFTVLVGNCRYELLRRPKVIRHILRIISPLAVSKPLVKQEALKTVA